MDKLNYIERLKDALHESDYKAIKHSEGLISDEDYQSIKEERQSIRDEINKVEIMTDEEYSNEYLQEESTINSVEEYDDYYDDTLM